MIRDNPAGLRCRMASGLGCNAQIHVVAAVNDTIDMVRFHGHSWVRFRLCPLAIYRLPKILPLNTRR
jgi:hypothetical protein